MNRAAIKAVASYLPPGKLTNEQLALEFEGLEADQVLKKTGIGVRHIAAEGECSSDLGIAAARRLFESGVCSAEDIDYLLFCTQTPDHLLPTTACIVQHGLGLSTACGAIDLNQGCSGYVYGLSLAKGLIETGIAENILFITSDTYSKIINPRDKSLRTLFGDGAAATLISKIVSDRETIGPFVFGSDGSGANELIVPGRGMRIPVDADSLVEREDDQGNWRSACDLYMNGGMVFTFTMQTIPATIQKLLEKAGIGLDDVDLWIPHQANKFMLDRLRVRLSIPTEKFYCEMKESGNTVSSTIPIALEAILAQGRIGKGNTVGLVGFGVGLSWAATIVEIV